MAQRTFLELLLNARACPRCGGNRKEVVPTERSPPPGDSNVHRGQRRTSWAVVPRLNMVQRLFNQILSIGGSLPAPEPRAFQLPFIICLLDKIPLFKWTLQQILVCSHVCAIITTIRLHNSIYHAPEYTLHPFAVIPSSSSGDH